MTAPRTAGPVLVMGVGLIGTSVALGLRRLGVPVLLEDASPTAVALGRDLGAGRPAHEAGEDPAVVVVAVPPDVTADLVRRCLDRFPAAVVTDVASVKGPVVAAVAGTPGASRYVGGHPMAGRERSGPLAGRADLFQARAWVLTPVEETAPATLDVVSGLVADLEAILVMMPAAAHDEAVALTSHVPQVAASLVAARLRDAPDGVLGLAGQGLRDVTRIAAGDPVLWAQILAANAGPVGRALTQLREDLDAVLASLAALDESSRATAVHADSTTDAAPAGGAGSAAPAAAPRDTGARAVLARLIGDGNDGQRLIPGKHGGGHVDYDVVGVLVTDQPGEIARLLAAVDRIGVNIEDIRIEHSLGRPTGLVEIAVARAARPSLAAHLTEHGWSVVS